jgi:hypothetical protein
VLTPGVNNGAGSTWITGRDSEFATPAEGSVGLLWSGEVPAQKWMNFFTKVLPKLPPARA